MVSKLPVCNCSFKSEKKFQIFFTASARHTVVFSCSDAAINLRFNSMNEAQHDVKGSEHDLKGCERNKERIR